MDKNSKKKELALRSSAAEYLTFVASTGGSDESFEMRYEDENIWLTQKMIEEFLKQIQAYNFNEKLFRVLAEHDINENSFLGHTITQLVIDELEAFYNILSEESGI